ncbi:GNAT family N-acetyltransferase [Pseudalkalibacillus hwajinpoensis]|uniref:GNAT family N-acetyltransferase n=1 Tax=Guptibacillus hwajinpoensis TaxID=208199 RepID=UPI001CFCDD7A|nr:GNAT family N-acetyltransferase [Pseudalkalibacillus hwajinpoensis]
MKVRIAKLQETDAETLFQFENENRSYFRMMVPDRGDDYYHYESFKNKFDQLLIEQAQGISIFYLIRDESFTILGRINLVDFDASNGKAELGYRIGEKYTGIGIASIALKLLLDEMSKNEYVQRISARTTTNNIASQKILTKNGFTYIDTDHNEVDLNGNKVKLLHYQWRN